MMRGAYCAQHPTLNVITAAESVLGKSSSKALARGAQKEASEMPPLISFMKIEFVLPKWR
jgi:hypothetical protein